MDHMRFDVGGDMSKLVLLIRLLMVATKRSPTPDLQANMALHH